MSSKWGPWVIEIELDADVPDDEADAFFDAVAIAVHDFEPRSGWDPHMSAHRHPIKTGSGEQQ